MTNENLTEPETMTQREVAKLLRVTVGGVRHFRIRKRNPLPFFRVGIRVRFLRSEVLEWLETENSTATNLETNKEI